jgi:hypothetical protein
MKSMSSRLPLAALTLASAFASASPAAALDLDLTPTLAANPKVQREIDRLCQQACLGDKRKSWLESAVVHGDVGGSSVTVVLKLRSKQAAHGFTLYEETATVRIDADLSLADCGLSNVRATSNNDIYRALLRAFAPEIREAVQRKGRFC